MKSPKFIFFGICILFFGCLNIDNNIDIDPQHNGSIKIAINVNKLLIEFGAFFNGKSYKDYANQLQSGIDFDYLDSKFSLQDTKDNQNLTLHNFKNDFLADKENVLLQYDFSSSVGLSDALKIFGSKSNVEYEKATNTVTLFIDLYNIYQSILGISNQNIALMSFSNVNFDFVFPYQIENVKAKNVKFRFDNNTLNIKTSIQKYAKDRQTIKIEVKLKDIVLLNG